MTDTRRITEQDADFQRIRNDTEQRLTTSIAKLVADLKTRHNQHDVLGEFINRHSKILQQAYLAAYEEGAYDYWHSVSMKKFMPPAMLEPEHSKLRHRLGFYAPSVAKMAGEALNAWNTRKALAEEGYKLDEDALDEWQKSLGARVLLQADLTWAGIQDGYYDGPLNDPANPYRLVYWQLDESVKHHCLECPALAAGSPYDPPGSGGNELGQTPGDGQTECGAACKCSLSYSGGDQPSIWEGVLPPDIPQPAPEKIEPPTEPTLTDGQKSALDGFRAAMERWERVRGGLPSLPLMFDGNAVQWKPNSDWLWPDWRELTRAQQQALLEVQASLQAWNDASEGDAAE